MYKQTLWRETLRCAAISLCVKLSCLASSPQIIRRFFLLFRYSKGRFFCVICISRSMNGISIVIVILELLYKHKKGAGKVRPFCLEGNLFFSCVAGSVGGGDSDFGTCKGTVACGGGVFPFSFY